MCLGNLNTSQLLIFPYTQYVLGEIPVAFFVTNSQELATYEKHRQKGNGKKDY